MNCFVLFVIVVALVTILDQCKQIPKFYARKFAHMLCGLLILMFDVSINGYRRGIKNEKYILEKFGVYKDKGIIVYNVIVSIFFFFKLPLYVLTPIFFADPMAAIVGRQFPNYAIYKKKTLHGTLTCFFVSLVTLFYVGNYWHILILSLSLSFLELFGGSFDNLLMCFPIFIYMTFFKV
ncbi:hypothetical protein PFLG_01458 [Plasmodium falciparum RAJ116]|uniref:Phosphatidate cytidylyltransferase n=1 Tax=Plasmodium falciparum RAJ116 TaxID=580058 RepID=A0A0L0CXP7_PLAFA|nr:hypothetical protein PFLG_01458 [Plasmodium falciparum RAJ116]